MQIYSIVLINLLILEQFKNTKYEKIYRFRNCFVIFRIYKCSGNNIEKETKADVEQKTAQAKTDSKKAAVKAETKAKHQKNSEERCCKS